MRERTTGWARLEWGWLLAFLLTLLVVPRAFGELAALTYPREVTVFPDGARVTREGSLPLSAGVHQVVFSDLPASVIESSLRLTVEGPQGTKLYGVSLRNDYTSEVVEERTRLLREKLQALEDQKTDLTDRIETRKTETDLLKGLAEEGGQSADSQGPTHPEAIVDFTRSTEAVGRRIAVLTAASRRDERAMRGLEGKITALQAELAQKGSPEREKRTAEADLELPLPGTARFALTYQVSDASWTPQYDLRLSTEGGKPGLELAFNAGVRQKTGEDWKGVLLTLSTSRPTEGTQVPDPSNWFLDFNVRAQAAAPAYGFMESKKVRNSTLSVASDIAMSSLAGADVAVPAEVVTAQTVQSPYAMSFSIPVQRDIPSDGTDHRVGVAQDSQPVDLALVAVPRLAQAAFLEAKISYEGEQALLPGQAQLFRDGDFVGTTQLEAKAPGESFDRGFGQDEGIRVERKMVEEKSGDAGFLSTQGEKRYHWVTTVSNFHDETRVVEVREQMPRSLQQQITVERLEISPKPQAEDPDKPGLVSWKLELKPKEKTRLDFAYKVDYPADSQVSGLE
jgi:uncharacterized protein (TIGR02231 family)